MESINNPQVKQFVDKLDIVTPLNPREAFFLVVELMPSNCTTELKLMNKIITT